MRMKKLLTFLTLLTLSIGVTWAETKTLSWAGNGNNDASQELTTTTVMNANGGGYYTGDAGIACTKISKVFCASSGNGLKLGSSSLGYITFSLVSQLKPTKITVSAKKYGSDTGKIKITVGNDILEANPGSGDFADIVFDMDGNTILTSFTVATTSKRAYVKSITITYGDGGDTPQPTSYTLTGTGDNGSIVFNVDGSTVTEAQAGTTVTATATANEGYEFTSWTQPPNVTNWNVNGNTATFTMPSSNVTVGATFTEKQVAPITGDAMILFNTEEIGTNEITQTGSAPFMDQIVEESQKYVSSVTNITKCYGKDGGIRISTSNTTTGAGSFTLNFSDIVKEKSVSQIIVNAKGWAANEDGKFSLTGITSSPITVSGTTLADYVVDVNPSQLLESLTVQGYGGSRTIIQSITLVFEEEGAYEITKVCDPAAGGSINCTSTSDANKTVNFTVTTNDNYEFEYVEVKDANDSPVTVTENNGTYSFTMPESDVTITAHFNQAGSLYILGQVNGNDAANWDSNKGVKMVYSNGVYTANVFVSANNGGYFAFRTMLANWGQGYDGSRWGSESGNWLFSDAQPNGNATLVNGTDQSFHLPNGIYQFTVNINNRTLVVTKVENATVSIAPNGGDIKIGSTATITESGLATFLNSCQPVVNNNNTTITEGITAPQVKTYYSTNGTTFNEGNIYTFNQSQEVALIGKAAIMAGDIELAKATKQATFRVKYGIAVDENLLGGSIGSITPSIKLAYEDDEVSFKVNPNGGYQIASVTVTTDGGQTITTTAGDNNIYTFDMPADNVTISATFTAISYTITLNNDDTKGTATLSATTANAGNTITITVLPNTGYSVASVTATKQGGGTISVTNNGDGTYTFTMQSDNVTVTVSYKQAYQEKQYQLITSEDDLEEGSTYIIVGEKTSNNSLAVMGFLGDNSYAGTITNFTSDENGIITSTEDMAIITLGKSGDTYSLLTDEGYFSNNENKKNSASVSDSPAYVYITIDEEDGTAYIEDAVATTYDVLSYNNSASRFAFYQNTQSGNAIYIYKEYSTNELTKPVINPASKVFTEEFDATITCSTQGATIYYTTDGTDPTTNSAVYSSPIHVDKTMTIKAIAAKDGETSAIAEAVYQCTMVENIAEYLALPIGTEGVVFKNPVVVQYHYISSSGKSYIYVKDDTGCAYFHQPYVTEGTPSMTQLENGDVIGARFYGDKDYDEAVGNNQSIYAMFTNLENFAATGNKALAEPELKTVSDIIATNAAELNNHYITIKKVKLSDLYQALSYGGAKYFDIYDETGTIGQDHIGYNKFNIDYESVVDDLTAYYNITGIFTAYNNTLEFHPTEIVKWAEKEVTLADLCENGEEGESYKITNNLQGVVAVGTSLWVKDENGQSIHKISPTAPYTDNFEIEHEDNTRSVQANYDQSNWCEIVFPDAATAKSFENSIIEGYSIEGVFNNKTNPKLTLSSSAQVKKYGTSDLYAPNFYLPANFVGSQSCHTDQYGQEGHGDFFFMTPKPQEYAMVVWAVYDGLHDGQPTFIMSPDKSRNSHMFIGEFIVDLSMNDGVTQTGQITEGYGYDFEAIIRKVDNTQSDLKGVQNNQSASYIVYPLNLDEGQDPVTSINDVMAGNGEVKSIKYVNVAGIVSDKPFQGVNIVVTEYTDGSRTTTKMLRK